MSSIQKQTNFGAVITTDVDKKPEKSRSRSKSISRSKASSISRSGLSMTSRSSKIFTKKVQPRRSRSRIKVEEEPVAQERKSSIFKSQEQEQMKQIIKLKNATTQLESTFKRLGGQDERSQSEIGGGESDVSRLEELRNFLEELDIQVRKQTAEIGENYMKQLDNMDSPMESKHFAVPDFKPISVPLPQPTMPTLQAKCRQFQAMLSK